jgi:diguanylate cyclase (GGDEF)-like protein
VISLKKYLDMSPDKPASSQAESNKPQADDLLSAILRSYRGLLLLVGKCGLQACPAVSSDLQQALANLESHLGGNLTPELVKETQTQVEGHLQRWGDRGAEYFKTKANDVKELLIVLARTAESVGERDQRYAGHFQQLTSQLHTIADLEDIGQVRSSLVKSAGELKAYVNQMAQDSHKSVQNLQAEVSTYEAKLKAAEEIALRDDLTGLANRRNVEERMAWRIAQKQPFCVLILDLNRFKTVNDTYGHLTGDSLLKQFAQELRSSLSSIDLVGRWSGDEFIVVLDCDLAGAQARVERVRKWAFGEYTLQLGAGKQAVKIKLDASIGLAEWQPKETIQQVIERADAAMYSDKKLAKKHHA